MVDGTLVGEFCFSTCSGGLSGGNPLTLMSESVVVCIPYFDVPGSHVTCSACVDPFISMDSFV